MTPIHNTATATFEPSPTSIVAALGGLLGARLNLKVQRLRVQQRRYCAQKHHRKEARRAFTLGLQTEPKESGLRGERRTDCRKVP